MFGSRIRLLCCGLGWGLCCAGLTQETSGDTLVIRLHKEKVLLYEPLVVEVTLNLEEPFRRTVDDPHEADRQLHRLRRRLYAVLKDADDEALCKGLIGCLAFTPTEEPTSEFEDTGLAFLQSPNRKGGFLHSERTGTYTLVVRDRERGMESNAVPITIVAPRGEEVGAAEVFTQNSAKVARAIIEPGAQGSVVPSLARLASEFPETPYGKYAIASLALRHFEVTMAEHNIKGGAAVWSPIAAELRKAASRFTGRHPLREKVLLDLATAYAYAGDIVKSREAANALVSDFPNSKSTKEATQLLNELRRKRASDAPE